MAINTEYASTIQDQVHASRYCRRYIATSRRQTEKNEQYEQEEINRNDTIKLNKRERVARYEESSPDDGPGLDRWT